MSRRNLEINYDKHFASVVMANQLSFGTEGYELQYFSLPEPQYYPEKYSFTTDLQKYINHTAEARLEIYKRAMRDIGANTTRDILDAKYTSLLQSVYQDFCNKGYSHKDLMEFCADVCTYTRCVNLKGLDLPNACPILHIERVLAALRQKELFTDWTYAEMDTWLFKRIGEIEKEKGTMNLNPIELSLAWINPPEPTATFYLNYHPSIHNASGSSRSNEGNIDVSMVEKSEANGDTPSKRKRLRI